MFRATIARSKQGGNHLPNSPLGCLCFESLTEFWFLCLSRSDFGVRIAGIEMLFHSLLGAEASDQAGGDARQGEVNRGGGQVGGRVLSAGEGSPEHAQRQPRPVHPRGARRIRFRADRHLQLHREPLRSPLWHRRQRRHPDPHALRVGSHLQEIRRAPRLRGGQAARDATGSAESKR